MANDFEKEITRLVADIIEIPVDRLNPNADFFKDLDVDSLKALEIVAVIERQLKIIVPEDEIRNIRNLNQVLALAKKLENHKQDKR